MAEEKYAPLTHVARLIWNRINIQRFVKIMKYLVNGTQIRVKISFLVIFSSILIKFKIK